MERKTYIDIIKGIAMLLVVMQHTGGFINDGIRLICKIDVPLFFLCSRFLIYKEHIHIYDRINKIFSRIFIPFMLSCFFACLFWRESLETVFLSSGKRGYWFLEALFIMQLLYYALYKLNKTKRIIIDSLIFEAIFLLMSKFCPEYIDNILGISYISRYFPCFIAGVAIRKCGDGILEYKITTTILLLLGIVSLYMPIQSTNLNFIAHVIGYLCASIVAFMFIKRHEKSIPEPIARIFSYFGKYSLNIYIIHFYLVHYITFKFEYFVLDFIVVLGIAVLVSFFSILIGKILTYCTPLNRILTP